MGCSNSKVDDLPAVSLCRERCRFLNQAVHLRYTLADSHLSYLHSLKSVGISLHHFFNLQPPPSPHKSPPPPFSSAVTVNHRHSHSDSDSHLHFHYDEDEDDEDDDMSLYQLPYGYDGSHVHMNYMKKEGTQSVLYQHLPMHQEVVYMNESEPSNLQNPNVYSNYPDFYGRFFGSSTNVMTYGGGGEFSEASSSKDAPPPPPSPPKASGWEFLNPFESFERYYPGYPSSRDSRELREDEGIPDLEDEDEEEGSVNEVVKEVHGDQKIVDHDEGNGNVKGIDVEEMGKSRGSESMDGGNDGV